MDVSWYWKKLVAIKNEIRQAVSLDEFSRVPYTIKIGYRLLETGEKNVKVTWSSQVWERMITPKHRFIVWLLMHNRLYTKVRLHDLGIISEQTCGICRSEAETVEHLFFGCKYSERCVILFRQRLDWKCKGKSWIDMVRWIKNAKASKLKKKIMYSFIAALIYHIWRVRNEVIWLEKLWTV